MAARMATDTTRTATATSSAASAKTASNTVRSTRQAGTASANASRWVGPAKIAVFVAALYPLARIVLFGFTGGLGANPIEFITRSTGLWTLVFICITLAV